MMSANKAREATTRENEPIDAGFHGAPPLELSRRLGVTSIVFMVVAAAAPLTVAAAVTPIVFGVSGSVAVPLFFLAAAILLTLFSVGFTRMSRNVKNAGAFYSYVATGLGRIPGAGAATLSLFSYFVLLVGVYTVLGAQTSNAIHNFWGLDTPWWLWGLIALALVAFLGYRDIELSAKVLGIALVAEALIVIILNFAIIFQGGSSGLSAASFNPGGLFQEGTAVGIMFAILGFIGFEATAVYRSEAKDPERTIPRATYIAVISIGVFYAFSSWSTVVGIGIDDVLAAATADPDNMVLQLAVQFVAPWFLVLMQILVVTSIFACALAFHNVTTRYFFTLSRFRLLPSFLGRISAKHRSPSAASVALSILSLVVFAAAASTGLDPVLEIYTWGNGLAVLGLTTLMALTSFATIFYFRRYPSVKSSVWVTTVAPILAFLGLGSIVVLVLLNYASIVGSETTAWVLTSTMLLSFLVGVILALIIRNRKPDNYRRLVAEPEPESETESEPVESVS